MRTGKWFVSALLILTITFMGCTSQNGKTESITPAATDNFSRISVTDSLLGIQATLESIYTRANPSVVNIQVLLPSSLPNHSGGALGSGFVWDIQGNLVTNNHVVDGATRMTVTFYDGTTLEASLVGTDADSDLAVIKVNPKEIQLQPVTMADSSQLKVGQLAIAIGNPFGLQGTMTVGFVSGLGRLLPANENAVGPSYSIPDIIQTDAAINPGNSGGVLLDATAKVIGVTSSIATTSGTSAGVGFAIPAAIVEQVVPALIKTGHYDHPYFGIGVVSLNPDLATAMNLPSGQRGALVQTVTPDSPADKAGLQASQNQTTINGEQMSVGGDVIITYNNQVVKSTDDLISFLARSGSVGQTVTLTLLRDGKQIQVKVTLGIRPSS
ncbi:MAG: trypsin-like peptidase domain-containing protein [Chloroflexi bacterium]|nr:trypsin-like peptidase domain-containing protein [Chloroflexota bacterium]